MLETSDTLGQGLILDSVSGLIRSRIQLTLPVQN